MLSEVNVKSYNGDEDKMIKDMFTIINDKRNVPRDDMVPDTGTQYYSIIRSICILRLLLFRRRF